MEFQMHFQVIIEQHWRSTRRMLIWRLLIGGVPDAETVFIS